MCNLRLQVGWVKEELWINGTGVTIHWPSEGENEGNLYLTHYSKINSRWIKELNVKEKTETEYRRKLGNNVLEWGIYTKQKPRSFQWNWLNYYLKCRRLLPPSSPQNYNQSQKKKINKMGGNTGITCNRPISLTYNVILKNQERWRVWHSTLPNIEDGISDINALITKVSEILSFAS